MKLEVGEYYLSAGGEVVKIMYCDSVCCYDINEVEYFNDGKYLIKEHKKDLIAHIPKQLHKHILNEINSYYTDKDFKEVVNSVWGDK